MDKKEKDESEKDFYGQGNESMWNFKNPSKATQEAHDAASIEQQFKRFQECNRGAFGTDFMRHSYLRDALTGETTGKGNADTKEVGPQKDDCWWLFGTAGQQNNAFNTLRDNVKEEE